MTSATTTTNIAPGSGAVQGEISQIQPPQEQPFPPPLVPETLQYRLETGNIGKTGGQRGSLTRCAQKFGTLYSKLLVAGGTPPPLSAMEEDDAAPTSTTTAIAEDIHAAKNDLDMELELYLLEATKLVLNQQRMQGEVEQLYQEQRMTTALLEEEQASVQLLQAQVAHAKEIRNCQLEYEVRRLLKLNTNCSFGIPWRILIWRIPGHTRD
jgi:hypothetical protein